MRRTARLIVLGGLLASGTVRAESPEPGLAYADTLIYGDVRLALHKTDMAGDSNGVANYSSRLGLRSFVNFPGYHPRWGVLYHVELGFERTRPAYDGPRLHLVGLKGPFGQLSYGRQWSAFYAAVGRYMDVGIDQSGFAYEGSERVSDSLQFSSLLGQTYLQVDAIRDERGDESGFNRLQVGLDYRGAVWRAGVAFDIDSGGARALPTRVGRGLEDPGLCADDGLDCFGASLGWEVDTLAVNGSVMKISASGGSAHAAALTLQWRPNEFSYYAELSAFKSDDDFAPAIAAGMEYRPGPMVSWFAEISARRGISTGRGIDHGLAVGVRLRLEKLI